MRAAAWLFTLLTVGGCAVQTERLERPAGVVPGVALQTSAEEPGAWTFKAQGVDLASYRRFLLDPPQIYRGDGASFGGLSDDEVQRIGQMFVDATREALGSTFPVVTKPAAGAARLRFTIVGVSETVPYVSTATRIIPVGAAINLLSQGAGRGGTLTGSVTYGVEAFDLQSGKLIAAAVRRLTPGAFDLSSTLGTMDTARAVARDAAAKLRATLDALHG